MSYRSNTSFKHRNITTFLRLLLLTGEWKCVATAYKKDKPIIINTYYDDIEDKPLSLENPIDWYYDGMTENGYANQCVISIFHDYACQHNLSIKVWGISFDDKSPVIDSENINLEIIKTDKDSLFAHIRVQASSDSTNESIIRILFEDDFCFSFFDINSDGSLTELDYYDDFIMMITV